MVQILDMKYFMDGNLLHVKFDYSTGEASGQNMVCVVRVFMLVLVLVFVLVVHVHVHAHARTCFMFICMCLLSSNVHRYFHYARA